MTPTQYAYPAQKFSVQSDLTVGFQARNCSKVMPNFFGITVQLSPLVTVCHLLQADGWPVIVGAPGDGLEDVMGVVGVAEVDVGSSDVVVDVVGVGSSSSESSLNA